MILLSDSFRNHSTLHSDKMATQRRISEEDLTGMHHEGEYSPMAHGSDQSSPSAASPANQGGEDDDDKEERRLHQRTKQIGYGYNTPGHQNMLRLLDHDPRLRNGGVLPLEPPAANMRTSKRNWDLLIRKWRRALHMFDHIFIEGEDEDKTTLADIVELQRQQWVSQEFTSYPKVRRVRHRTEDIMAVRGSDAVPKKLPVEDSLVPLLRSMEHYDPIHVMLPEFAPPGSSPQSAGIKILVAPLEGASASKPTDRSRSPSPGTVPRQFHTAPRRGLSPDGSNATSSLTHSSQEASTPQPPQFDTTPYRPSSKAAKHNDRFAVFREGPTPQLKGNKLRSPQGSRSPSPPQEVSPTHSSGSAGNWRDGPVRGGKLGKGRPTFGTRLH